MLRRALLPIAFAIAATGLAACDDGTASSDDVGTDTATVSDTSTSTETDTSTTETDTSTTETDATETATDTSDPGDTTSTTDATSTDATTAMDTTDPGDATSMDTTDPGDTVMDTVDMVVEACGDGVVDTAAGETCDTGIAEPFAGFCPSSCPVFDACQPPMQTGTACTTECSPGAAISACADGDGCCPSACDSTMDSDCAPPTAFRPSTLSFLSPTLTVDLGGGICLDANTIAAGLVDGQMEGDENMDGWLDLSFLLKFEPYDTTTTTPTNFAFGGGLCSAPSANTTCNDFSAFPAVATTATNGPASGATTCLEPIAGTTFGTVAGPTAPCFASQAIDLRFDFAGISVPLSYARVAGRHASPTSIDEGIIMGFIDETTAEGVVFPDSAGAPIAGRTLASLLSDGTQNCMAPDERVTGPDGDLGWWFYIGYEAGQVTYTGMTLP